MADGSNQEVSTASTEILPAATRRGFILHNPSVSVDLWCKLGETAVVGEGFVVKAGTSVAFAYEGEFNFPPSTFNSYSLAVNGIYASGTEDVAYQTL